MTNKSQEGSQFCRGFGGIGGILRYQVRLQRHSLCPCVPCTAHLGITDVAPRLAPQVDLREFDADSDGVDGGEFYSDSD